MFRRDLPAVIYPQLNSTIAAPQFPTADRNSKG